MYKPDKNRTGILTDSYMSAAEILNVNLFEAGCQETVGWRRWQNRDDAKMNCADNSFTRYAKSLNPLTPALTDASFSWGLVHF